ncbi:MAG: hypothetical protein RLZZ350_2287 [Verrucomicrobiota bacterium]|jgi:hypothetical protein
MGMKRFTVIFSFLVFFIPLTSIGVALGYTLWDWPKSPNGEPTFAIIVVGIFTVSGFFVGRHSARATIRR